MPGQQGSLSIVLHAHLPWVVNHGTWPHGLEWLLEAAAEAYLPLLAMLRRLEADGIVPGLNVDLSPVLLEQMAHPVFQREFPEYLRRKVQFAREDEAFFAQAGEEHFAGLARFWQGVYGDVLQQFEALRGDMVGEFRRLGEAGLIELMTCSATHGYSPLLGTDESVRAQVRLAVQTHRRHFGRAPRGMWLPECGYRPAGYWQVPVAGERAFPGFHRIGVDQALAESGLRYFFADAHLIQGSNRFASPYGGLLGGSGGALTPDYEVGDEKLYQPYGVADGQGRAAVAVFPRDPRTGFQVWSGDAGYPADGQYLDFHKKRWPGGHRYWRVTGAGVDLGGKQAYAPAAARARTAEHARHFVGLVERALEEAAADGRNAVPILCSPFDAELFGHWWFEGVDFLEEVLRRVAGGAGARAGAVRMAMCGAFLERHPAEETLRLPEGSWGAGGDSRVWLNDDTSWTYVRLYAAEHALRDRCTAGGWRDGALGEQLVKQMCREVLLMEASDWPFLITTGAARDYAERRFAEHADCFDALVAMWPAFERDGLLDEGMALQLREMEARDDLFPDVNPEFWVLGASAAGG